MPIEAENMAFKWLEGCGRKIEMWGDSTHCSDSTVLQLADIPFVPLLEFEECDNLVLHYIGAIKRHPDSLTMQPWQQEDI